MQIEALFAETLKGEYDDEAPWQAVHELRRIGSREVFETASDWCRSDEPLKRARGADVLAQLGCTSDHPEGNYPEESYAVLAPLAESEKHIQPLSSAIHALGHIGDPRAIRISCTAALIPSPRYASPLPVPAAALPMSPRLLPSC